MNALDRLAADMDAHNIRRVARYKVAGRCYVQLLDGREGVAETFKEALQVAEQAPAARLAA